MPEKVEILRLIKQLVADVLDWSQSEIELTRVDAKAMMRNYIVALGFAFASFAILIAAVFTLAQTVIGAIASYVHGHIIAGLIVSVALFALTMLMLVTARYFFMHKSPARGLIFRRLKGSKLD